MQLPRRISRSLSGGLGTPSFVRRPHLRHPCLQVPRPPGGTRPEGPLSVAVVLRDRRSPRRPARGPTALDPSRRRGQKAPVARCTRSSLTETIDAHATALVEVTRPVVPPREGARLVEAPEDVVETQASTYTERALGWFTCVRAAERQGPRRRRRRVMLKSTADRNRSRAGASGRASSAGGPATPTSPRRTRCRGHQPSGRRRRGAPARGR